MTVAEIKAIIPEAEVYVLEPDAKYIILMKLHPGLKTEQIIGLNHQLKQIGITVSSIVVPADIEDPIRLLKVN